MELHPLSEGYSTLDKSLLVYTKYQGQIYEAALKPLLHAGVRRRFSYKQASEKFQRHTRNSIPQPESRIRRSGSNFRNTE